MLQAGSPSPTVDRLARLAAELLGAPQAQVSLLHEQQHIAALVGGQLPPGPTPVKDSLCSVTTELGAPLLVDDAPQDLRVSDLPPVTSGKVGAYIGVPLVGGDGMTLGALCVYGPEKRSWTDRDREVLQDLAKSVVAELELRALTAEASTAAARLELVLDATGIGTFDLDVASGELLWDERLLRLFGYSEEEFGRDYASFEAKVHVEDRQRVAETVRHALEVSGEFTAEYRVLPRPGVVRWVEARGRLLGPLGSGHLLGVAYDSTELREARDRLSRTLETMTDAFYSVDRQWRFTYVNRRAEELLARTRDDLLGADLWEEFPDALDSPFERHYRHAVEADEPVTFEAEYAALGGVYEISAWPGPDGLSVYFREITARRQAEAAREEAVRERERAYERLALLGEASLALSETLRPREVLDALGALVVPHLADGVVVVLTAETLQALDEDDVPSDPAELRVVHVVARDDASTERLRQAALSVPLSSRDEVGIGRAVRTRLPEWLPDVPDEVLVSLAPDEDALAQLRELAVRSALSVPLVDRGRVLGAVSVVQPSGEQVDLDLLVDLSSRVAVALDNALLFAAQERTAETLQRSLLPRRLPTVPGVTTAVRYLPGSTGAAVGGDWYQGVRVGEDLVVAMGDVMGHGMHSAARMGQLRAVVATLALEGLAPGALLERLARLVDDSDDLLDLDLATLLVASLSPDGRLRVASAGHPPPLLGVPGEPPRYLDVVPGPPVGTIPVPLEQYEVVVPHDATLVLFTDGLVERRDEGLDDGLERLRAALEQAPAAPEAVADHLLRAVGRERGGADDVALLVLSWQPPRGCRT